MRDADDVKAEVPDTRAGAVTGEGDEVNKHEIIGEGLGDVHTGEIRLLFKSKGLQIEFKAAEFDCDQIVKSFHQ